MQRLAHALTQRGTPATEVFEHTADGWRALMSHGRAGRLRARLSAWTTFLARSVASAARQPSATWIAPRIRLHFLC